MLRALIALLLLPWLQTTPHSTDQLDYRLVRPEIIESRVRQASPKNAVRHDRLKDLFHEVGCAGPALAEQPVKNEIYPNIICMLPGESDKVLIVGAHYDAMDAGDGILDNWSGASLLPSLFDSLRAHARRHSFLFVAFASEEKGLIGSEFFAKQLTAQQRAQIDAMINMDTLGLGTTCVWAHGSDQELVRMLSQAAGHLHIPLADVNFEEVGSTDSESFRARKIPTLAVHSLTQRTLKYLHSTDDNVRNMDMSAYYQSNRLMAYYLAYLDQVADMPKH